MVRINLLAGRFMDFAGRWIVWTPAIPIGDAFTHVQIEVRQTFSGKLDLMIRKVGAWRVR